MHALGTRLDPSAETNYLTKLHSSFLSYVVVQSKGGATHPHLIIGGSGGTRIPTATAQGLRVWVYGLSASFQSLLVGKLSLVPSRPCLPPLAKNVWPKNLTGN